MRAADIQKSAEVQIVNKLMYKPEKQSEPLPGGPLDLRLVIIMHI